MTKTTTLRVDTAFAGMADRRLEQLLSLGYRIVDKTELGGRYIYYILRAFESPNEQSDSATPND